MNNIKQIDVSGHRYDICDANMRAAVTGEYDVLAAYTAGDFCIYNNVLYRCLEDTTGAWQEEKWEKKTLAEMHKEMELMTHISDAFSVLKEYTAGKYCIYENTLYRFTSTKSAGEWDPGKAVKTTVDEELSGLNENIPDFTSPVKNAVNIDTLPPGFYWINGFNTEHTGTVPFTNVHYVIIGRGTTGQCDMQIAFPNESNNIKVRHRDSILSSWGSWIDQVKHSSFRWGYIADLNDFKQFGIDYIMFGNGTGYNNNTKNSPVSSAFTAMYIPYDLNYGVQLVFSVQKVHGAYPIYKRMFENNTWDYWTNISCPCNRWEYNGTQDWDGYLASGLYSIGHLTGNNAPSGVGVGQWGYLEVSPWGEVGTNGCLQRYYSTSGKAAFRIKFDGRWSVWALLN